jgi:hypothetical protein
VTRTSSNFIESFIYEKLEHITSRRFTEFMYELLGLVFNVFRTKKLAHEFGEAPEKENVYQFVLYLVLLVVRLGYYIRL